MGPCTSKAASPPERFAHIPLDFLQPASIAHEARGTPTRPADDRPGFVRASGGRTAAWGGGLPRIDPMPVNATLSAAQLLVLSTAIQRSDRLVLPLPPGVRARGAVRQRLLAGLLKAGLAEEVVIDHAAAHDWRTDEAGRRHALRATSLAVAAVDGSNAAAKSPPSEPSIPLQAAEAVGTSHSILDASSDSVTNAAAGSEGDTPPPSHGDMTTAAQRPASGALHAATSPPRPGGKLGRVLDALAATQGATLTEIVTLTGWQPHSARAALTGLRQRGFAVALQADPAGRKAYRLDTLTPA